jgi:hypothetical protein
MTPRSGSQPRKAVGCCGTTVLKCRDDRHCNKTYNGGNPVAQWRGQVCQLPNPVGVAGSWGQKQKVQAAAAVSSMFLKLALLVLACGRIGTECCCLEAQSRCERRDGPT